jgi:hypothetical protein
MNDQFVTIFASTQSIKESKLFKVEQRLGSKTNKNHTAKDNSVGMQRLVPIKINLAQNLFEEFDQSRKDRAGLSLLPEHEDNELLQMSQLYAFNTRRNRPKYNIELSEMQLINDPDLANRLSGKAVIAFVLKYVLRPELFVKSEFNRNLMVIYSVNFLQYLDARGRVIVSPSSDKVFHRPTEFNQFELSKTLQDQGDYNCYTLSRTRYHKASEQVLEYCRIKYNLSFKFQTNIELPLVDTQVFKGRLLQKYLHLVEVKNIQGDHDSISFCLEFVYKNSNETFRINASKENGQIKFEILEDAKIQHCIY